MAEWAIKQILLPNKDLEASLFNDGITTSNGETWSSNIINLCGGGFVRQLSIHGLPGTKIYAGALANKDTDFNHYLQLGPSGVFQLSVDNNYLLSDIRIAASSYRVLQENNNYISFDMVTSYAPSGTDSYVIIFNGGGYQDGADI